MRHGILLALLLALVGCGRDRGGVFDGPDSMTVYSLDGFTRKNARNDSPGKEWFHDVLVRGSVQVTDASARNSIVVGIREGIEEGKQITPFKCLDPHEGVRIVRGGQVRDYLICFMCKTYEAYDGEECVAGGAFSAAPRQVLTRVLLDANLPVGPPLIERSKD
jgi:hypothetical protein